MPPSPAPTPAHARQDASAVVAAALRMAHDDDDDVAAASRLFQADYDCCDGRVVPMVSSPARVAIATAAASQASQRRLHSIVDEDGNLVPPVSQAKRRRTPGRTPRTPTRSKRRDLASTPSRSTPRACPVPSRLWCPPLPGHRRQRNDRQRDDWRRDDRRLDGRRLDH